MKKQHSLALACLACTAGSTVIAGSAADTRHAVDPFGADTKKATCIEGLSDHQGGEVGDTKTIGGDQQQAAIADADKLAVGADNVAAISAAGTARQQEGVKVLKKPGHREVIRAQSGGGYCLADLLNPSSLLLRGFIPKQKVPAYE